MYKRSLMKWKNLLENRCPSCGADLTEAYNMITRRFTCRCTFSISEARYSQVVNDMTNRKLEAEHDKELNKFEDEIGS